MFGTGVPPVGLVLLVVLGFTIATTVNTFAMEAAVLFTPAFLFVFPVVVPGFPAVTVNAAIGLALFVELFGYSSSVAAYWYRHQIDFDIAAKLLAITVPVAVVARAGSYYVPSDLLMLGFGLLLVVLAVVLYEAHEHGPSVVDTVAGVYPTSDSSGSSPSPSSVVDRVVEKPELSLLAVLDEEYEPRTRVWTDTHDAAETPPSQTMGGPASSPAEEGTGRAVVGGGDDTSEVASTHERRCSLRCGFAYSISTAV